MICVICRLTSEGDVWFIVTSPEQSCRSVIARTLLSSYSLGYTLLRNSVTSADRLQRLCNVSVPRAADCRQKGRGKRASDVLSNGVRCKAALKSARLTGAVSVIFKEPFIIDAKVYTFAMPLVIFILHAKGVWKSRGIYLYTFYFCSQNELRCDARQSAVLVDILKKRKSMPM